MVIRNFKKNSKLDFEEIYILGERCYLKGWYYRKENYGYTIVNIQNLNLKSFNEKNILGIKEFYQNGNIKIDGNKTSPQSDTLIIKSYNPDTKIVNEETYVKGDRHFSKQWYYNQETFGYTLFDERKLEPKYEYFKEFYLNNKTKVDGVKTISKGTTHGRVISYYPNGQITCECNYKNDKRDSIQVYHNERGYIENISNYRDNKQDGKTTYYFDNGKIWSEIIYKYGKPWEVLTNYDVNGKLREKGTLKDGNGSLYVYDELGNLTDIEYYKNGILTKTDKKNSP